MLSIDKARAFCVHFSNGNLELLIKSFTLLGYCCHIKHLLEEGCRESETDRGREKQKANLERIIGASLPLLELAKEVSQSEM